MVQNREPLAAHLPSGVTWINLQDLPNHATARVIVGHYIKHIDWLCRALHVPTFERQCREHWSTGDGPLVVVDTEKISFLLVYVSVLVVTLHLADVKTLDSLGYTVEERPGMLHNWWANVLTNCLSVAEWQGVHTMGSLQSYL